MTNEGVGGAVASLKTISDLESATVRFAGDSGDGMQLVGGQFSDASAIFGNDISTFPDYPAEIRAPAGSLAGVSGFQVNFSSLDIHTPGDQVDALVAMNPAALKTNLADLIPGGVLIVNSDAFTPDNLEKAGYAQNPLTDGSLEVYKLHAIPITTMNRRAVDGLGLEKRSADRCKNFFTLGLACWLYGRPLEPTITYIDEKFAKNATLREANVRTLKAGFNYGETTEMFVSSYRVEKAEIQPGTYRKITGNEAVAIGLIAAAKLADKQLFYGSYPITPASDILHELSRHKEYGVITFQAEDEIAAIGASIGAAFGGCLAITGSSGPGVALKTEAIGLAVMTELPLVIVNIQRGGPSTGLPTKTEQADLFQAVFGRNGETPVPVIAAASPADCFDVAIEASRIAMQHMTPIILLSDGYIANGSDPWRLPDVDQLPKIDAPFYENGHGERFLPYERDERLVRRWVPPGTPGLMHRIGGLEKADLTGNVSYDADNHQFMVRTRQAKVDKIADDYPPQPVLGERTGDVLIVSWGGTYGAVATAIERLRAQGKKVSAAHLRYLNPLPHDLGELLRGFRHVLVPELNLGQLRTILRARYLVDAVGLNKVKGKPFMVREIVEKVDELLGLRPSTVEAPIVATRRPTQSVVSEAQG
ncbi:MAG: 2-oxoacid:acceptor oxidoreductase subunit alpha [Deltaproteobacteria bacterium]|nr:2-oxoacid:acceptor oxidoreductase subunit alpha [Deltaproteobacteria bacterium]